MELVTSGKESSTIRCFLGDSSNAVFFTHDVSVVVSFQPQGGQVRNELRGCHLSHFQMFYALVTQHSQALYIYYLI